MAWCYLTTIVSPYTYESTLKRIIGRYCDGILLGVHLGVFGSIWKVEERDEQRQTSTPTVIVKYVITSIHDILCCCISSIFSLTDAYNLCSNLRDCM